MDWGESDGIGFNGGSEGDLIPVSCFFREDR